MNPNRNSKILLGLLGITTIIILYFWLILPAFQISNERKKCESTPVSELQDKGDYIYCLQVVGER